MSTTLAEEVAAYSRIAHNRTTSETVDQCLDEIIEFINADKALGLFQTNFGKGNPFYNIIKQSGLIHSHNLIKERFPNNTYLVSGNIVVIHKVLKPNATAKEIAYYYYVNYLLEDIYTSSYDNCREVKIKREGSKFLKDKFRPYIFEFLEQDGFKYSYIDAAQTPRYHTLIVNW